MCEWKTIGRRAQVQKMVLSVTAVRMTEEKTNTTYCSNRMISAVYVARGEARDSGAQPRIDDAAHLRQDVGTQQLGVVPLICRSEELGEGDL